jgi:hypothetical protein
MQRQRRFRRCLSRDWIFFRRGFGTLPTDRVKSPPGIVRPAWRRGREANSIDDDVVQVEHLGRAKAGEEILVTQGLTVPRAASPGGCLGFTALQVRWRLRVAGCCRQPAEKKALG